jgi:uncharacterized repeat protein (TIGR02543 family)
MLDRSDGKRTVKPHRPAVSALLVLALLFSLCPLQTPADTPEADSSKFCTVRFFSDGISSAPVQTQLVEAGDTAANPGPAAMDPAHIPISFIGKYLSFLGWYEAGAPDDKPYDFSGHVTGDLDLYARFTTDLLVSYLDGYGNVFLSKRVAAGAAIPIPDADEMRLFTAPSGKHFGGWTFNGLPYDENNPKIARTDTTLSSAERLTESDHYVFFVSDGSQTPFASVRDGDKATRPPDPTRQGYDFSRWSATEGGPPFDFNAPISEDTTLHAVWTANRVLYTVVFWYEKPNVKGDPGDPGKDENNAKNYDYYRQFTQSGLAGGDLKIDGQAFAKAHSSDAPPYGAFAYETYGAPTILGNGSAVVNLYFKRNVYTFAFELGRADATLNIEGRTYTGRAGDERYAYEAKYEEDIGGRWPGNNPDGVPALQAAESNRFCVGWTTPESDTPFVSKVLTVSEDMLPKTGRDQTVTARWSASAHTVRLHYMFERLAGDDAAGADVVRYNGKDYAESKLYSQTLLSAGTTPFGLKAIDGMKPLTARALAKSGANYIVVDDSRADQYLFYDRLTYGLDFNAQGGSARKNADKDYKNIQYGADLADYGPDTPIREEGDVKYRFDGWYYDADGLRPFDFESATMPGANVLLFAKWSSTRYTVSVYDDLTRDRPLLRYQRGLNEYVGDPAREFAAQKIGNPQDGGEAFSGTGGFLGWVVYVGPGMTAPLSRETPVTQDMAIHAKWETKTYNIVYGYELGEGTGAVPTDDNAYVGGAQARVAEAAAAPSGKHFIGWWDNYAKKLYNPGALIVVNRNIALTARFAPDNEAAEIVYHNNNPAGADGAAVVQYAKKGEIATLYGASIFDKPSRADHRFVHWSTSADGNGGEAFYAENAPLAIPTDTAAINLYAIWAKVEHHIVRFDAGEHGTFAAGATTLFSAEDGETLTGDVPIPTADANHKFTGWLQPPSSESISSADVKAAAICADTVFVAQYRPTQTELRFHANYTPLMGPEPLVRTVNVTIESPKDDPTETQYYAESGFGEIFKDVTPPAYHAFLGWSETKDGAAVYAVGEGLPITDAAVRDFYAVWRDPPVRQVTFDAGEHGIIWDGSKAVSSVRFDVTQGMSFASTGAVAPIDAVAEETWRFVGWDKPLDPDAPVLESETYKARYEQPENELIYHANPPIGGDDTTTSQSSLRDKIVTLPGIAVFQNPALSYGGYDFVCWTEGPNDPTVYRQEGEPLPMTDDPYDPDTLHKTREIHLYAKWKSTAHHTVRFVLGDETGTVWSGDAPAVYVVEGNDKKIEDVLPNGKTPRPIALFSDFTGWREDLGNDGTFENDILYTDCTIGERLITQDITYMAQYVPSAPIGVTYFTNLPDANDTRETPLLQQGSALRVGSFENVFGASALPEDKIFIGWGHKNAAYQNGGGLPEYLAVYTPETYLPITYLIAPIDLCAMWKDVPKYAVEFLPGEFEPGKPNAFLDDTITAFGDGANTIKSTDKSIVVSVPRGKTLDGLVPPVPPIPAPAPGYGFAGWSPRLNLGDPVTQNTTYTAIYQSAPLRFAREEPPTGSGDSTPQNPPGPYEIQVVNYEAEYDATEHTIRIRFGDGLKDLHPQVYYSNPATPKTINWVRALPGAGASRTQAFASRTRLFAAGDASGFAPDTGEGFLLPAFEDVGAHELPLYFTADGFAGAGIIRSIKVTPRTVDVTATHEPIYAGDPAPTDYAVSVANRIPGDDSLNANALRFDTDYRPGMSAGDYPILVLAEDGDYGDYGSNYKIRRNTVRPKDDPYDPTWVRAGTLTVLTREGGEPTDGTTPPSTPALNRDDHYAYLVGYPDGMVHPERNITREEAATIFFRLLTDETRDAYKSARSAYPDVDAARWSNEEISTLSRAGILTGYPDGSFRPAAPMTRAEFTAIAARFDGGNATTGTVFGDTAGHWAQSYIDRAYALGWVTGYEDGSFRPDRDVTRAEVATLINRALERRVESAEDLLPDMRVWPDNADTAAWYYFDMQEASNSHAYERKSDGVGEKWTAILKTPTWD